MRSLGRPVASLTIAALLATSTLAPPAFAGPQAKDDSAAVAAANRAMSEALAQQQAIDESALSPKERKALEKERKALERQRKKEQAAREREERQAQKQAEAEERKAQKQAQAEERRRSGKSSNKLGKAIGGCLGGALVGVLIGALAGGKNKGGAIAAGAAAGCALGAALGLSKKDEQELNAYVDDDYALRDDLDAGSFHARETGKTIALSKGDTTYENRKHKLLVPADIAFDPGDIKVNERYMRATSSLRMRSAPSVAQDNINGGFRPNDKLRTYGTTQDGQWTYVVDKTEDGYVLLGYAATKALSSQLKVGASSRVVAARPSNVVTTRSRSRSVAPESRAAKPRAATFTASTACKSMTLATGGKSANKSNCGGGANLAIRSHDQLGVTRG